MVTPLPDKLLIVSRGAGSLTDEIYAKRQKAFDGYLVMDFEPNLRWLKKIRPTATVVAAGGDGTIGFVARALIDTEHPFGVLSLGTFNNFARSLGLPNDIDLAIEVITNGRAQPITIGRVNGKPFLEAAAVGLFGEAIALGEAAKDMTFGELRQRFRAFTGARAFDYKISGDLEGRGHALSLVFANTPSIGAQLPVANKTPKDAYLELSVHAGERRTDLVARVLRRKKEEAPPEMAFKFSKLVLETEPRVHVYTDNKRAGWTPATIEADVGALKVMLPRG